VLRYAAAGVPSRHAGLAAVVFSVILSTIGASVQLITTFGAGSASSAAASEWVLCVCLYSCLSWIASDPRHWCPVGVPQVVAVKQSRRTQSWRAISECRVIHSCPQDGRSHGSRHEHGLQVPRRIRFTGTRVAHGHGVVQECLFSVVVSEKRCPRLAEGFSTIWLG
jgi:hypothetical protein